MIVIGIDIGLSGAIAVLTEDGELIAVEDLPALADGTGKRRTINPVLLAGILFAHVPIQHAYVEYVGADPARALSGLLLLAGAAELLKVFLGRSLFRSPGRAIQTQIG